MRIRPITPPRTPAAIAAVLDFFALLEGWGTPVVGEGVAEGLDEDAPELVLVGVFGRVAVSGGDVGVVGV